MGVAEDGRGPGGRDWVWAGPWRAGLVVGGA